ncbi:hypothetical protein EV368DRAFT_87549 [Lentinula lateritia]|nr:hypothetical protein EV368DRAFT_87549 [Lentinula lateritia]
MTIPNPASTSSRPADPPSPGASLDDDEDLIMREALAKVERVKARKVEEATRKKAEEEAAKKAIEELRDGQVKANTYHRHFNQKLDWLITDAARRRRSPPEMPEARPSGVSRKRCRVVDSDKEEEKGMEEDGEGEGEEEEEGMEAKEGGEGEAPAPANAKTAASEKGKEREVE